MTFETSKRRKLKRMPGLRIMNAFCMVAWRRDAYGEAQQKIRLLHPFSWVWTVLLFLFCFVAYGVPETVSNLIYSFKNDTVWW